MNEKQNQADIYSVTRLNREVKAVLEGSFPCLWIKGEISNLALPASGHWYFSLKDAHSQVRCAMFRGRNRALKFSPENGDEVLVYANVGLYEGRGEFQLIVEQMEPSGEGALQKAFDQLKQKLLREGLFEESHKKRLPAYPHRVGVITSPSGAAIRDILHVLKRRYPLAEVIIYPVPVQGESAAAEIRAMLNNADTRKEVDVLIIARGGGSIEDLWAFNDEALARAIHASDIPIVSGIGHEIDFTIADFVADRRAPTPSAAAEIVCVDQKYLLSSLAAHAQLLQQSITHRIKKTEEKLASLGKQLKHPNTIINEYAQTLDYVRLRIEAVNKDLLQSCLVRFSELKNRLLSSTPQLQIKTIMIDIEQQRNQICSIITTCLLRHDNRLQYLSNSLQISHPEKALERGYSITRDKTSGKILKQINQMHLEQLLELQLTDGKAACRVEALTEKAGDES